MSANNITPVMNQSKILSPDATSKIAGPFQAKIVPENLGVWQILEALIGSTFIEGKANTTIACGTCRDVEWFLDIPEEDLSRALIKHAEQAHPLELANAISLLQGEQVNI
ncbi:hypothetical protein M407DRAFT_34595 [Tulasnella calospora MUT 4182]|uniref:Uncharacterized protein n=1 Tax=Tulasnella calospora MUT 4182 TaxID=1051891 RepID=A0A0C3PN41_9AGAM|nr:hypothetical protein M407DRAFT_34595 [Tulasnella calospora MUT 4182]